MILLAVNFHYVADAPARTPRAIFPVTPEGLAAQLETIGRHVEFVSRDDLLGAVDAGRPLPDRGCVITFDDGLRCHAEQALPVLERLGVPAIFFVSGRPLVERRALHVHRVHHLREHLEPADFAALLERHLAAVAAPVRPFTPEHAQAMYRYDSAADAHTKYLLNVALDREAGERVVEAMFAEAGPPEEAFVDALYLSADQVRALEHEHAALGAHGFDHHPFAALDPGVKVRDMQRSADALREVTGVAPAAISYPYGSAAAVTSRVGEAAARLGFRVGFSMERALNRSLREPLLLARVDTNDAPGGKRPLLDMEGDEPALDPSMAPARVRYFDETEAPAVA